MRIFLERVMLTLVNMFRKPIVYINPSQSGLTKPS